MLMQREEGQQVETEEALFFSTYVINGYSSQEFLKHKTDIDKIKNSGVFLDFDNMDSPHFSEISGKDKFTERLCDCTGVVLFGRKKNSTEIISMISHASEVTALFKSEDEVKKIQEYKEKKEKELKEQLSALQKDLEGTSLEEEVEIFDPVLDMDVPRNKKDFLDEQISEVREEIKQLKRDLSKEEYLKLIDNIDTSFTSFKDAADGKVCGFIVGGQIIKERDPNIDAEDDKHKVDGATELAIYNESIKLWQESVFKYFGINIDAAHHPLSFKGKKHGTDVYVDTQNRKIFIVYKSPQPIDAI